MASEIRVNTLNSRAGLGTITMSDSGITVAGIVTATSFVGDGSALTGITGTGGGGGGASIDLLEVMLFA